MIPHTYPSTLSVNNQRQMVVFVLSDVSGLTRWIDYIPVKPPATINTNFANTFAEQGYIVTNSLTSISGKQAWLDYIPVYIDYAATTPYSTNASGYIPMDVFAISNLFAAGEQGAWYDPSDFSTMFQDAAGTTPVTAVGQPVGLLLDKSKGLALSGELVTNGTFNSNITGWTAGSARSNISWNTGKLRVSTTFTDSVGKSAYQAFPVTAGKWYVILGSATLLEGTVTTVQVALRDSASAESSSVVASSNLMLHTVSSGTFYYYADTTRTLYLHCRIFNTTQPCKVDFDNISAKEIAGNHATQTTSTKRPVLQQDANGKYYLLFDGIDDALQTTSVNFTGTDSVTIWAGIHQLTDVFSVITELSTDRNLNLSAFTMATRSLNTPFSYGFYSKGTLDSLLATGPNYLPPITNTITGIGDISSDTNIIRANGVQVASIASDQGTGNYGNHPLYIGARGGTIAPFNGRLYSLIIRGAQSTATQISNAETYVNSKTGAY